MQKLAISLVHLAMPRIILHIARVIVTFFRCFFSAIVVGLSSVLVWYLQEKLGATSDSIPDMNEKNDGDGSYKKQPDSDAQS
jgi:hypothetical protein